MCRNRPSSPPTQPQQRPLESTSESFTKNWRANTPNNDRSQFQSQPRGRSQHVNDMDSNEKSEDTFETSNHVDDSTSSSIMTVYSIESVPPITYNVEVNDLTLTMEIDSGSCYSIINSKYWQQLGQPELAKGTELRDVSRNCIPVIGMAYVDVRLK